jgi:hypothetical protein
MSFVRALLLAPLSVIVSGSTCTNPFCFVGDVEEQPTVELVFRDQAGAFHPVVEGGDVPMVVPDQGGLVMLFGVRAKNMDVCNAQLSVAVHDPCTAVGDGDGRIISREGRPLPLAGREDGWAVPDSESLANFANVPACPNAASTRDLDGHPYLVRATLTEDDSDRTASAAAMFVPTCDDDFCRCLCDSDQVLGESCDLGPPSDALDPAPGECPGDDDADAGSGADAGGGADAGSDADAG